MAASVRQSYFEFLRLVCMMMVLSAHAIGYVDETVLTASNGVWKTIFNQFFLVCVNVFVMISGWFGIKASWKGAGKLLFQVLYISMLCVTVFLILGLPVSFHRDILPNLLFGSGDWFVVAYLILYAISPILNAFIEHASQKEYRNVLIAWMIVEFVYGFLLDTGHFAYGFSPLSCIGLYLLARYVRLYPCKLFSLSIGQDFLIYAGISLLSAIGFWFGYKWFGMGFHLNHYDSPLAIIASLYFLLAFSKMRFQNKVINWLASSAFAIYLIHTNSLVYPHYVDGAHHILFNNNPGISAILLSGYILIIALICIVLDKPRVLLWKKLSEALSSRTEE